MTHSLNLNWDTVEARIGSVAANVIAILNQAEEGYQDLLEAVDGRNMTDFAKQLFNTATPTQIEIDMVTDARDAMIALHQLYEAARGTAATQQGDRYPALRRMA